MVETINKLIRISRQLLQELGREPTAEELAVEMQMPEEKVREIMKIAQEPVSLETPIGEEAVSYTHLDVYKRQPILYPVVTAMGVDVTHFGIIMVVNLAIGFITPPLGVNLFVASRVGETTLDTVIKGIIPLSLIHI